MYHSISDYQSLLDFDESIFNTCYCNPQVRYEQSIVYRLVDDIYQHVAFTFESDFDQYDKWINNGFERLDIECLYSTMLELRKNPEISLADLEFRGVLVGRLNTLITDFEVLRNFVKNPYSIDPQKIYIQTEHPALITLEHSIFWNMLEILKDRGNIIRSISEFNFKAVITCCNCEIIVISYVHNTSELDVNSHLGIDYIVFCFDDSLRPLPVYESVNLNGREPKIISLQKFEEYVGLTVQGGEQ
ncbi:MAG: hypothetical protein COA76_11975 [Moritella sp.]|nr:MAG: hypothetical protein COA76_11975 [Moritella sp.]